MAYEITCNDKCGKGGCPNATCTMPVNRSETSRLYRFWCWLWYGHDKEVGGRTVAPCGRCGAIIVGGD